MNLSLLPDFDQNHAPAPELKEETAMPHVQQSDIFGYVPPPPPGEEIPPTSSPRPSKAKSREASPADLLKALDEEIDDDILTKIIEKAESIRRSKELILLRNELKERIDLMDLESIERINKFIEAGFKFTEPAKLIESQGSRQASRGIEIDLDPRHCDKEFILKALPESRNEAIPLGEFITSLGIERSQKSYIQKFKRLVLGKLLENGSILKEGEGRNTRYFKSN